MATTGLKKVERGNLSEQVYASIRSALMDGEYEPGDRLRISALANELGVSITPVREAIFRLVSDHVLEMKAATAVHVPQLTADQLREVQLIRFMLEGEAAALAAQRIQPKELERMRQIQQSFQKAASVDPKKASLANREFHFALIQAARVPIIYATVENMWAMMGPLLRTFHATMPRRDLASGNHKHFDLLEALGERDSERARRAIQDDIRWGDVMVQWVENNAAEKTTAI